jgi:hypothetical protein
LDGEWEQAVKAFPPGKAQSHWAGDRGRTLAALGRWDEAVEDLTLVDPNQSFSVNVNLAALHLLRGDVKGYQQLCCDRLSQPDQLNQITHGYAVWTAALGADSPIDPRQMVQWAEQKPHPRVLGPSCQGLAYYRAGRFDAAVEVCRKSLDAKRPEWLGVVTSWPVLALAYHKLDQPAKAQECLAVAAAFLAKAPRGKGDLPLCPARMDPMEWLVFQVLYREAKALVPATPDDLNAAYERWAKANAFVPVGDGQAPKSNTPEPKDLVIPGKPDPLGPVYKAMKLSAPKVGAGRFKVGDNVRFDYELKNTLDRDLRVPFNTMQNGHLLGTFQYLIERLGDDATIPAMRSQRGEKGYPAGGLATRASEVVTRGQALPFVSTISTTGFPPGRYRYHIDYQGLDGKTLQSVSVEFELVP